MYQNYNGEGGGVKIIEPTCLDPLYEAEISIKYLHSRFKEHKSKYGI